MSYAAQKGNGLAVQSVSQREARDVAPLSDEQRDLVANNYTMVKQHMPELVPVIKELHALGMIDGLRAIQNVQVFNGKEP